MTPDELMEEVVEEKKWNPMKIALDNAKESLNEIVLMMIKMIYQLARNWYIRGNVIWTEVMFKTWKMDVSWKVSKYNWDNLVDITSKSINKAWFENFKQFLHDEVSLHS